MSSNVLADKDINAPATNGAPAEGAKDVKSMEYHRQVLQSKLNEDQYVLLVFDTPPFSLAPANKSTTEESKHTSRLPTTSWALAQQSWAPTGVSKSESKSILARNILVSTC